MEGEGFGLYNFEEYGDWWKARLATDYDMCYYPDEKLLAIRADIDSVCAVRITFAVEVADVDIDNVVLYNTDFSDSIECNIKELAPGRFLAAPFVFPPDDDSSGDDGDDNNGDDGENGEGDSDSVSGVMADGEASFF